MYRKFTVMLSFPRTWFQYFRSTFLQIKKHCWTIVQWHWKWSNSNVTLVNERQQITWHHAQNVVSLRVLYKFVNFNSTLVICLKFVFIEMLDKLITYIVLPVAWTNRIITRLPRLVVILAHTTDSTWYRVLYQHIMYVMGIYVGLFLIFNNLT